MKLLNAKTYIVLLFVLTCFSNCNKDPFRPFDFQIYVDSIAFKDTIQVDDTLFIEFYGVVGPNGCHSFKCFKTERTQNNVLVEVIGRNSGESICPTVMVYLDGEILQLDNLSSGVFNIIVKQPDNSELTSNVVVE